MAGQNGNDDFYGRIQQVLEEEVARLYQEATPIANAFWDLHFWHRQNSPKEQWGRYGVRVRRRQTSVSIDWYRMVFYGPPGDRRVTHNHLKRGDATRYKRSTFKNAAAWEIEAIMAAEVQFDKIRRAADRLAAIGQQARYYDATLAGLANQNHDNDRDDTVSHDA